MYHLDAPKGWAEVLFHLGKHKPDPSSFSDLSGRDYALVGTIPLMELDGPYDLYQILFAKRFHGQPREVRSFDVINVVERGYPILSYAIVSPQMDHKVLSNARTSTGAKVRCEIWPQFPHGLVKMATPIPSMAGRTKA